MVRETPLATLPTDSVSSKAPFRARRSELGTTTATGTGGPHRSGKRSYGVVALGIFVAYMALATGLYHFRGVGFIFPDRWAIVVFIGAIIPGQ